MTVKELKTLADHLCSTFDHDVEVVLSVFDGYRGAKLHDARARLERKVVNGKWSPHFVILIEKKYVSGKLKTPKVTFRPEERNFK